MATIEKFKPLQSDPKNRPRWRARWRDPSGKQKTQVFTRRVDAEAHLTSVQHRIATGEYVDRNAGKVTVEQWCETWRRAQVHRQSTQTQVETYFRRHLYPTLGHRELGALRPSEVQAWVTGRSAVLAPGSVEIVYRHFFSAMKAAELDRLIAVSPCRNITLPKKTKLEVIPPSVEQVEALSEGIQPRYRGAVILAAGGGLRLGEVFGMQLDRIDFMRRQIRVDQQLITLTGAPSFLAPPKTQSSVRTVPLADLVLAELAEHIRQFPPVNGYIFTTELDNPVRRRTFSAAWTRAKKTSGATTVRFHDLRHHYASVLISAGCSVKAVQKALGHASAVETLETYAHLWPEDEDHTRNAIEAAWSTPRCVTFVSRSAISEA